MKEIWTCPNCGAEMKRLTDTSTLYHICPICGCSMEGKEQNFDSGRICPNCHYILDNSIECSHCGYDLGSDFD